MESLEFKAHRRHRPGRAAGLIEELNGDPRVDGILVQSALPKHLDEQALIAAINPEKDVDGFHVVNSGRLAVACPRWCRAHRSAA